MKNAFLFSFSIIFSLNFSSNSYRTSISCSFLPQPVVQKFDIVNKLIEATFNGYDCLNIFISGNVSSDDQSSIIRTVHKITHSLTVRLIKSLENAIHHCGFLVIENDMEGLKEFRNVRYDDVIRLLYIDFSFSDNEDTLQFDTDEMGLHDMDLALAKLRNASDKTIKIYAKTRYENLTRPIDANFSKPFFDAKTFVPKTVNYNKRIVRFMTFHFPIFNIIVNGELVDGVEARVYREFERKLNFTSITMLPTDGHTWGLAFPNGTITGGMLKKLYERETDVGFCAFWIDFSKLWVATFSNYWEFQCLKFLIPKPKVIPPRWDNILKPLPSALWILVLSGIIIVSSTSYLLRYVEKEMIESASRSVNFIKECLTIIGIFLLAKNPEENHGQGANRHIFMWWSVFSLLVTTLYSSSLVSHLAYPQFEPMIENVEGLVKGGYYWGTDYPIVAERFMDVENPWHVAFMRSYKREANKYERLHRLLQGNYSIMAKIMGEKYFLEVHNIPVHILRDLRTTRNCEMYFYLGFIMRKAFPLTLVTDQIIRQLIEGGIIEYWFDRMFEPVYPLTTFARVYEYKTPLDEIERAPLRLENLQGAFFILIIGILIACVAFVGEIFSKRKRKMY